MDAESTIHLERLRARPEYKAALLRFGCGPADEVRFERSAKNTLYWAPIERLSAEILAAADAPEIREEIEVYGRPCWLLATCLTPSREAPLAIAVTSTEGEPAEELLERLRSVSHDYWYGSSFWK